MARIFISANASDASVLASALEAASFEVVGDGVPKSEGSEHALEAADAALVVLPEFGDRMETRLRVLNAAVARGMPVVLVETPAAAPVPGIEDFVRLRSDLQRDVGPVVSSLQALLRNSERTAHKPGRQRSRMLVEKEALHWRTLLRDAAMDDERFTRHIFMFLSELGVELTPPREVGPDFVAWSEELGGVLGNPFLVEIKRRLPGIEEPHDRWIQRAGVQTLVVLVGEEFAEASTRWTIHGGSVIEVSAVELVDATEGGSLLDGFARILWRVGVR